MGEMAEREERLAAMDELTGFEDDEPTKAAPVRQCAVRIVGDRAKLFSALAKAQGAFTEVTKDKVANVQGRDGKQGYKFAYASLDAIQAATVPALSANGLAIVQVYCSVGNDWELVTMLTHEAGGYMEVSARIPGEFSRMHEFGGAITYSKRYQWSSICGVSAIEDDDANGADGNQATITQRQQTSRMPPKESAPIANPITEKTDAAIGLLIDAIKLSRPEINAICKAATGKMADPKILTEEDGQKFKAALEARLNGDK